MIKRWIIYALLLSLIFSCFIPVVSADEAQTAVGCKGMDASDPYLGKVQLVENVSAAFLYERNSDSLLYAWNADSQQFPASLVKIMTALLVIENASLEDEILVSQESVDSIPGDAISVDLQAGELITVQDLLYCLMVKSANDAAVVLAEHIAGSQSAFVTMMNARAEELGCTGTNYVNVHGLHDDAQVTTARDTCRILDAALNFEFFRTIFGTAHYKVEATNLSEERLISTNNFFINGESVAIYQDERVTGGRTGVTADGFRCIASVAENRNMEVICIVMGSASTFLDSGATDVYGGFPETIALYNLGFGGNDTRQILFENQIVRQQKVINGDSDVFVACREGYSAVLPSDYESDDLQYIFEDAPGSGEAPIEKDQHMGKLKVMHGTVCIAEIELYAANKVPLKVNKSASYIDPEGNSNFWIWILVIVILLVGGAAGFLVFRKRKRNRKNQSKLEWRHEEL